MKRKSTTNAGEDLWTWAESHQRNRSVVREDTPLPAPQAVLPPPRTDAPVRQFFSSMRSRIDRVIGAREA